MNFGEKWLTTGQRKKQNWIDRKSELRAKFRYKPEAGTDVESYRQFPFYQNLKHIFRNLQRYRGHHNFIRAKTLPRCDFFVPHPGFIVEFDETQHFTSPRRLCLEQYPSDMALGFSRKKWIELCEQIDAKDNDPVYRDEQRAWYDALRDFLPSIMGLQPTVRLFSKDECWCSLNPDSEADIKKFQSLLGIRKQGHSIRIRQDANPRIARIIIAGEWSGDVLKAKQLLNDICREWPKDQKSQFLMTCGTFLTLEWPGDVKGIKDNRYPEANFLNRLISEAQRQCNLLLDDSIRKQLNRHADYLTIGIDSYKEKISLSSVSIRMPHIELVALVDLKTNKYYWSGKSYPTAGQEHGLVRIPNLKSHFIRLPAGRVMVLGCHDLNIFSVRGKKVATAKWRKEVRSQCYALARKEKPEVVLHHPHTTDSPRIWAAAWKELQRAIPSVKRYAGCGRYFNEDGARSDVESVLRKTKCGDALDFVVDVS